METNKLNLKYIDDKMIEMVQKAIRIIQEESHNIVVEKKIGYDGIKEDLATNGDKKAQEMYVDEIRAHFPTFGIIAEEKELAIPSTHPRHNIYFTVDPLDGTKAYERGQSHGVGTMIALICDGEIIAAYIGDANTREIFGFVKNKKAATRARFGKVKALAPQIKKPLDKQYVLLRDAPHKQDLLIQKLIKTPDEGGMFKDLEIASGGIGVFFGRLWNGEVGAVVLRPNHDTPWDLMPVLGISRKLGFKFFKLDPETNALIEEEKDLITEKVRQPYTEVVIHERYAGELADWMNNQKQ